MSKGINLSNIKTLLEPILHIIGKKAERPSWNENDPTSASYIAGRTHYTEKKFKELAKFSENFETTADWDQPLEGYIVEPIGSFTLVAGETYTVIYDGTAYRVTAYKELAYENIIVGNGALVGAGNEDNGLPFAVGVYGTGDTEPYAIAETSGMHTFTVSGIETVVHKIAGKYLPDMSYVSYKNEQDLTDEQKYLARQNIGASNFGGEYSDLLNIPNAVLYSYQTTTESEKMLARQNIGAVSKYYELPDRPCGKSYSYSGEIKFSSPSGYTAPSGKVFVESVGAAGIRDAIGKEIRFWTEKAANEGGGIIIPPTDYAAVRSLEYSGTNNNTTKCWWGNMSLYSDEYEDTGETWCAMAYYTIGATYTHAYFCSEDDLFFTELGNFNGIVNAKYRELVITPLEDDLIPGTIQRVGGDVIIPSSTEGSAKKFKITVDDTGAITATEVTT